MSRVFISYSSKAPNDRRLALELYDYLVGEGFQPWVDVLDLEPGVAWKPAIKKALREARYVVVLLSRVSCSHRGFFQREMREALELSLEMPAAQRYLIPARVEACDVPDSISEFQWVDLFPGARTGFARIAAALHGDDIEALAIPVSAVAAVTRAADGGRRSRSPIAVLVWYVEVLFGLLRAPKRVVRERNHALRSDMTAAAEFVLISSLPYSVFNALLPLHAEQIMYHIVGYLVVNLVIVLGSAIAVVLAWRIVGSRAPAKRFTITTLYYGGVSYFAGFIIVMLAIGALKFFDKDLLRRLREAAAGDLSPLLDPGLVHNKALLTGMAILALGNALLLLWTYFFWGSYREIAFGHEATPRTKGLSVAAWLIACVLVVPAGAIAWLLQQAFFNRV